MSADINLNLGGNADFIRPKYNLFGSLSSVGVEFTEFRSFIAFEGIFMFVLLEGYFGAWQTNLQVPVKKLISYH